MFVGSGGTVALSGPVDFSELWGEEQQARDAHRTAAAADLSGFVVLYEGSYRRLVAQLSSVTGDLAEAEDLVQEAFVRAAQRWDVIADYDAPEMWVRRVAMNLALSSLRRAKRRAALTARWGRDLEPGEVDSPDGARADRSALLDAMRRLPMRYRVVLALHYLADLDVRGISEELRIPEATVKTRLARGRRRLRTVIEETEAAARPWPEVAR